MYTYRAIPNGNGSSDHIYMDQSATQVPTRNVGPAYKPEDEKPTATVSTDISYENVHVLPQTPQLIALMTCVDGSSRFPGPFICVSPFACMMIDTKDWLILYLL